MFSFLRPKKPVIFVGARMALDMMQNVVEDSGYQVIGLLDKYYYGNTDYIKGIPVIGSEDWLMDSTHAQAQKWLKKYSFVLTSWWDGRQYLNQGLDSEIIRQTRMSILQQSGADCPSIVHPSVKFRGSRERVKIGHGTVVEADCTFGPNISLGNFCYIDWGVSMYTNVHIKNNVIVGARANLGEVTVNDNCRIGVASLTAPIGIKQHDHMTVGQNAVVWMGCHAYKNIPDDHVWAKGDKILSRFPKNANET